MTETASGLVPGVYRRGGHPATRGPLGGPIHPIKGERPKVSDTAFEQLVISRLVDLAHGHDEIKHEIVAVGRIAEQALTVSSQTLKQAELTNGRVALLEGWQDSFEDETDVGEAFAAGRRSRREEDMAVAWKVGKFISKYTPYGAGAILIGIGIRIGAWFIGGVW